MTTPYAPATGYAEWNYSFAHSVSLNRPAAAGEVIALFVGYDKYAADQGADAGGVPFTKHQGLTATSVSGALYTHVAAGGEQTINITTTTNQRGVAYARTYPAGTYVPGASAENETDAVSDVASGAITVPAVAAGPNGGKVLSMLAIDTGDLSGAAPSVPGMTLVYATGNTSTSNGIAVYERDLAPGESFSAAWDPQQTDQMWAVSLVLNLANEGGGSEPEPARPPMPTGLLRGWKGSDLTGLADGAVVQTFTMSDGTVMTTNADFGTRPTFVASSTNGKPAIRFDHTLGQYALGSTPTRPQPVSTFMVLKPTVEPTFFNQLVHHGTETFIENGAYSQWNGTSLPNTNELPSAGSADVLLAVAAGGSSRTEVNGTAATGNTGTNGHSDALYIGRHANAGRHASFELLEFREYDHALTADESVALNSYAQDEYGIPVIGYVPAEPTTGTPAVIQGKVAYNPFPETSVSSRVTALTGTLDAEVVPGRRLVAAIIMDKSVPGISAGPDWALHTTAGTSVTAAHATRIASAPGDRSINLTFPESRGGALWLTELDAAAGELLGRAEPAYSDLSVTSISTGVIGPFDVDAFVVAHVGTDSTVDTTVFSETSGGWTPQGSSKVDLSKGENIGQVGMFAVTRFLPAGETAQATFSWTPNADQAHAIASAYAASPNIEGDGEPPVQTSPAVTASWIGAVGETSAKVYVRQTGATSVRIEHSASADFSGSVLTTPVSADARGWSRHSLTGLPVDSTRHWRVIADGKAPTAGGTLRTLPTAGQPANHSFAMASCWQHTNQLNPIAFDRISARDVDWFDMQGDLNYLDTNSTNAALYHSALDTAWADSPRFAALARKTEINYQLSDHDFAGNASHAGSTGAATSQAVYRDRVPTPSLPSNGLWWSRVVGRVLHVYLDTRTQRSSPGATDNESKVLLGATQEQWLKDLILATTEKLIIVRTDVPWPPIGSQDDHWGSYRTEQRRLLDWFGANLGDRRMVTCSGDAHMVAVDSGEGWEAAGVGYSGRGIRSWSAAPIANVNSTKGGPWSGGTHTVSQQQYAVVTVQDDGTTITATFRGYRADTDALIVSDTITVAPPANEPPPVGLAATPIDEHRIRVTWPQTEGATYDLEADGVQVLSGTGALAWTHEGLEPDTEHTYRYRLSGTGD